MTRLEDIEKAITGLPPEDLARFRAWFDRFEAARFDERLEKDAREGRLDGLAEEAIRDHREGKSRPL